MKSLLVGILILVAVPVIAQEFQYEFRDGPRPEADVVVVRQSLRQGPGADFYLVGRLFNRGLKPANNVRVVVRLTDKYGAQYPTNPIYLNPSDIPPTTFVDFEGRILPSFDPRDVFIQARAEWSE